MNDVRRIDIDDTRCGLFDDGREADKARGGTVDRRVIHGNGRRRIFGHQIGMPFIKAQRHTQNSDEKSRQKPGKYSHIVFLNYKKGQPFYLMFKGYGQTNALSGHGILDGSTDPPSPSCD
jgi:hypothetical protein